MRKRKSFQGTYDDAITKEPLGASSITQPLPDKQTLELIIVTLQRNDIYEIFAEPVDLKRERDAFQLSGTIFFRQAHGIDKLPKRVFHVLRTNPENFESEFSGSRRRSCRRSQDEIHEFNSNFSSKASEKTSISSNCLSRISFNKQSSSLNPSFILQA
ncbi:uncharacterized protein LOC110876683 [Helianthus annuus]|uniref:uncharacterized protein LOC110876683 n=1 Tax=Helianthus annuus TaxID=4232 RepID=UPI000B8F28EA|nr:uncharacterized protein LOC110876683 [Helianthus annuus]